MTTPHSMTLADLDHKFRIIRHFQKYYLRDEKDLGMRKLMLEQSKRVIAEIRASVAVDQSLKRPANEMVKEYDVKFMFEECKNG